MIDIKYDDDENCNLITGINRWLKNCDKPNYKYKSFDEWISRLVGESYYDDSDPNVEFSLKKAFEAARLLGESDE